MAKYIFVTGGVVSGLGKGITAASLGRLLKSRGLKVAAQKLDPYMNVDPGTMSPLQHGEVFVTNDGAETDLDLGHYERFIDEDLNKFSNLTSGKVYWTVLNKERNGEYLGSTVQIIPHVTNEIKSFIYALADKTAADVVITEIGGTIGDIESQPFLEAIRQISIEKDKKDCLFIHVTLVPYISASSEHKSKPTQHSVKELMATGIFPDIIVLRSDEDIEESVMQKIALFCNVKRDCVIENNTVSILYEAPVALQNKGLDSIVCRELGLDTEPSDMSEWKEMLQRSRTAAKIVRIAMVGKYTSLHDAYLSINEALKHAGWHLGVKVVIDWIDSETINEKNIESVLKGVSGILIPGGFGDRGIEGMVCASKFARENKVPFLGICLGMQVAVIEFARSVLKFSDANSNEFSDETKHPVISLMPDQKGEIPKGGTMRLGSYPCVIKKNSLMDRIYKKEIIDERHRHRYEFTNEYRADFEKGGMEISGLSPDGRLVEAVDIPSCPFFLGVQFHPEFKSRPNRAEPSFVAFVEAAMKK